MWRCECNISCSRIARDDGVQVCQPVDVCGVQVGLAHRSDGDGHILQILRPSLRGNDDLRKPCVGSSDHCLRARHLQEPAGEPAAARVTNTDTDLFFTRSPGIHADSIGSNISSSPSSATTRAQAGIGRSAPMLAKRASGAEQPGYTTPDGWVAPPLHLISCLLLFDDISIYGSRSKLLNVAIAQF